MKTYLILPLIVIIGLVGCEKSNSKKKSPDPRQRFLKEFAGKEEVDTNIYFGKFLNRAINEDGSLRAFNKVNGRCSIVMTGQIHSVDWLYPGSTNTYAIKYSYTNMNYFVKPCEQKERPDYNCNTEVEHCYSVIAQYQTNLGVVQNESASQGQAAKYLRIAP